MGQLINENQLVVSRASMCVAAIAAVELPLGQWEDFLETITNAATGMPY